MAARLYALINTHTGEVLKTYRTMREAINGAYSDAPGGIWTRLVRVNTEADKNKST